MKLVIQRELTSGFVCICDTDTGRYFATFNIQHPVVHSTDAGYNLDLAKDVLAQIEKHYRPHLIHHSEP